MGSRWGVLLRVIEAVAAIVTLALGALTLAGYLPVGVLALLLLASVVTNIWLLADRGRLSRAKRLEKPDSDSYRYESLKIRWKYTLDPANPETWLGVQTCSREITALAEVRQILVNITKLSDSALSFRAADGRVPSHRLLSYVRASDKGHISLAPAHRADGTNYSFYVVFSPPLQPGEPVKIEYELVCPQYKFAYRDDVVALSASSEPEVRDVEFNRYTTSMQIKELQYEVVLPESLGAVPAGLTLKSNTMDVKEQVTVIDQNHEYSQRRVMIDGEPCWVLALNRKNPLPRVTYYLNWRPPARERIGS